MIAQAVEDIQRLGEPLGLHLNPSKCEIIEGPFAAGQTAFRGFIRQDNSEATLLGAPIAAGKAMDDICIRNVTIWPGGCLVCTCWTPMTL